MMRVHVLCEGYTEVEFVDKVPRPHFSLINISLYPSLVRTSKMSRGRVTTYGKVRRQLVERCKEDRKSRVTILRDLYGLPRDFPAEVKGDPKKKAEIVKQALLDDIDQPNFIPNVVVHEFESLLFSDHLAFGTIFNEGNVVEKLVVIRNKAGSPEHIDQSPTGAPSKRIKAVCRFRKTAHGVQIASDIGLDTIRRECPLFDDWVREIEKLKGD